MSGELREKVIKGLECCAKGNMCRNHCPYDGPENDIKNCTSQLARDALSLLKAQETSTALWIHCGGKSHIWYCSNCGEKVNYNNARRTYTKGMKPIEEVNRFCRGCGAIMLSAEQRKVVKRSADASDQTKMV